MAGFFERLTVLCFAGTYGLALASDLARFVVRAPARWYLTVGLTALGWLVQTAYLANLAWRTGSPPVTTPFESLLVLSWVLAAIDLYLLIHAPKTGAAGLFVLPVVLGLVAAAGLGASRAGWVGGLGAGSSAFQFWGASHGVLLVAGSVCSCVAFAAGLMYLVQSNRLKHKRPARFGLALPSLEQSERLNRAAIIVAFPLLTAGLLIGLILTVAVRRATGISIGWTDPKVISTIVMWLVFAVLLHARFRPEMRGRRVMILTAVAFLFLAFSLFGLELLGIPTAHGGAKAAVASGGGSP
jgi:ABC-type transport system involved in cytochrome c biogenesis permease subunit